MKITLVGVGALGSHLVQFIRSIPDVTIKVVDFDRVEAKNTMSQFHAVGPGTKVASLSNIMLTLFRIRLQTGHVKVTSANSDILLADADLIVDCTDNAEARRVIRAAADRLGVACLHGGLSADGTFGVVTWNAHSDQEEPGQTTCENGEHLPFIALTSACLAVAVQRYAATQERMGYLIGKNGVTRAS